MIRILLSIAALLALAVAPTWCGDPATPAAKAADFPAQPPAPGAAPAAAVQAGLDQAAKTENSGWHLTDVGSGAIVAGVAALAALEKVAPALLLRFLPMAGPYGGIIQLVLQGLLWLLKPKAQKEAEQLQADHADAFRALASTIQTVSNAAPVAALKERLLANLDPSIRQTIDDFVTELEAQGIDHDAPGSHPPGLSPAIATIPAAKPAA